MKIKNLLSDSVKIKIHLWIRGVKDVVAGRYFKFSKERVSFPVLPQRVSKMQPITDSSTVDAKINNLQVASVKIEKHVLNPGQIFSFWNVVGSPVEANGFQSSRAIVKDELSESIGGGLCLIAGLMYYMSLEAGLKIMERSSHSLDLYTDETRYTPLGSDASVVYGYKDLRIRNNYSFPIRYTFKVTSSSITIFIRSSEKINLSKITFKERENNRQKVVSTFVNDVKQMESHYSILDNSK